PEGVEVKVDGNTVSVKGPKGELSQVISDKMGVNIEGNIVTVERKTEDKEGQSLFGTTRSLVNNMIEGVSKGFQKELEIVGVGYRAQLQGTKLVVGAGYSHPVEVEPEENIEFEVPKNTEVIIKGIDKNALAQLQLTFEQFVSLSRIKEKEFVIKVNMYVVKKVKLLSK